MVIFYQATVVYTEGTVVITTLLLLPDTIIVRSYIRNKFFKRSPPFYINVYTYHMNVYYVLWYHYECPKSLILSIYRYKSIVAMFDHNQPLRI
ncbi:uncharacterized protein BX663DRAFT_503794 [Cokeromyces recurvatus]|uniref:uncharacterized protein n=1 Tax=Cokeromyces recurvatus TaxID=90255 RepID=UPI00221EACAA|nr:uncharacterized protein BX663DRAFT_503794 [Cokeromyces recurvatus]KAI7904852.1 hypothetical protein BX663DRAFT_503794 [Cokeromyces recurvatus]